MGVGFRGFTRLDLGILQNVGPMQGLEVRGAASNWNGIGWGREERWSIWVHAMHVCRRVPGIKWDWAGDYQVSGTSELASSPQEGGDG